MEDVTFRWARARAWALVFAYAGGIWMSSSGPSWVHPPQSGFPLDKALHAVAFGGLAWLLLRALSPDRRRPPGIGVAVAAVLLATGWGVLDEVHQMFVPGRAPDVADGVADLVGAVIGVVPAFLLRRRRASARMLGAT